MLKLYMTSVFEVEVRSITTAKEQLYLDKLDADACGARKYLLSTTLYQPVNLFALEKLVNAAGRGLWTHVCSPKVML